MYVKERHKMADSRYEVAGLLEGTFSYKLDSKTKRRKNLLFYQKATFKAIEDFDDLDVITISYNPNDTLMGLSQVYYDDPAYWWVIAWTNNVGSEQDLTAGQELVILTPLTALLSELGV